MTMLFKMRFLIFIAIMNLSWAFERQLIKNINPDCPSVVCDNGLNISMVHVSAFGSEDVIHYLWDYTGKPSVLIAVTPLDSELHVNCTEFCNGHEKSITFTTPTLYNFSVIINRVFEYNDENDYGLFEKANRSNINIFNTNNFDWKLVNIAQTDKHIELSILGDGYSDENTTRKGSFFLSFKAFARHGHDNILPHLLHTANSSQVELQLENIELDNRFNSSRFAVEMLLVSPEGETYTTNIESQRSLDDEYAPGVFELIELTTSRESTYKQGGYIQYRPVSYTSKDRQIANSTDINRSSVINITDALEKLNHSTAYSFYDSDLLDIIVNGMNVSFGTSGDGFYKNRNFTNWTFTIGFGTPPQQKFSVLVIIVVSIALGTPFLLMIAGGIYFCCQHYVNNKRERLLN